MPGKNPTKESGWKTPRVTRLYLEGVRRAVPWAEAQIDVLLKVVALWRPSPRRILDLGCGDGILGRALLSRFPRAQGVFVDFSDPMLAAARVKLRGVRRAAVIKADYSRTSWTSALPAGGFDVIVSGFSIHHQPDRIKRRLYKQIEQQLRPSGVFLNLEHVRPPTPAVEALFDDYFVDHLYTYHRQNQKATSRSRVARTYYDRPDKCENILAPLDQQCRWLKQIGLTDVDCFFKVFDLALFGGRKPARRGRRAAVRKQ